MVSSLRGFPYSPLMWGLIGIIVGPFVGIAAAGLRHRGVRAALGGGLLAGIGLGEALYGLTAVAATTGIAYWIGIGILSLVLFVVVLVSRARGAWSRALLLGVTVVVALALAALFRLL
jgi:hypothetical protein